MNKMELVITALALTGIIVVALPWAIIENTHIDGPVGGSEIIGPLLVLLVVLLLFPALLLTPVCKCYNPVIRQWIWGVTIAVYFACPAITAAKVGKEFLERMASEQFESMLRNPHVPYGRVVRMAAHAGYSEDLAFRAMLEHDRMDFAERYFKEHPEAHYSNLPFIMNYCLSRLDKDNYCDSVSIRNARKVEFLLDNGWEINDSGISDGNRTGYYSESHLTALCIAIRNRDIRTANLLIERGADVNLGNPLAIAVNEGDRKRVQMLLERGAEVNAPYPESKCTALHAALKRENPDIVELLRQYAVTKQQ